MVEFFLRHRRIVLSCYLLLAIIGIVQTFRMPVQLLPTVDRTEIQVAASWLQNAPEDVEVQMAVQLENALSTLPALQQMETQVSTGSVFTTLRFEDGADPIASLIATGSRLNQVQSWPADATEPEIIQDGISEAATVATLLLYPTSGTIADFTVIDETARRIVMPALLDIPGVSRVDNSFSSRNRLLNIEFDPLAMGQLGITVAELQRAVTELRDSSGGVVELGKDRVALRFEGQPAKSNLDRHVILWREGRPVTLGEVANIYESYSPATNITYKSGREAYYLVLLRGQGKNSFEIVQDIKERIDELNTIELAPLGLELGISFDTTENIERSIANVFLNLVLGVVLVYLALFFFLRRHGPALVVISSVPLSVFLTLLLLSLFGVSLNVVSLAALAFSVGLIIDAAVVVLEAIEAARVSVHEISDAIRKALAKVAKALFASTLTTLLIFIPIAGFDGDIGNLLSDLALTMALAMSVSFLVAMLVLPLVVTLTRGTPANTQFDHFWNKLAEIVTAASRTRRQRLILQFLLIFAPIAAVPLLLPERELLPFAGDSYLRASIAIPDGRTVDTLREEIAEVLIERLNPYLEEGASIPIRTYNLVVSPGFAFLVAYPTNPKQMDALIQDFQQQLFADIPEIAVYVAQEPMIRFRSSDADQIELNVHGDDLARTFEIAQSIQGAIIEAGISEGVRITPAAATDAPVLTVVPKGSADRDFGFSQFELASVVGAYSGGLYAGEYLDGLDTYDIYLRGPRWQNQQEFGQLQVFTPSGETVNLETLAGIRETRGPSNILRVDGLSTVRLLISPPEDQALGAVVRSLRELIATRFSSEFTEANMSASFQGSADEFEQAMFRIGIVVVLALLGLGFALTLTFGSFASAFKIMLTLPIAIFGGAFSLWAFNFVAPVSLDILTIMGFIIAAGLVLNNAILIIAEYRDGAESGLSNTEALREAVKVRSRPIYISALTSIFGMLPLMLSPGVGAETYRGMATVLVGAMTFSVLFGVFVVSALTNQGEGGVH